jgi:7-cyano-7-deazaguanine synthase
LASGGLDSAVLLSEAVRRYDSVTPVYVRKGLRWESAELAWLRKFLKAAASARLRSLKILDLPMREVYARHWGMTGRGVPGPGSRDRAVFIPGRNIALLSKAACFAALKGIRFIEIGVLKANPFPDGSPGFFKKLSAVLSEGLGTRIEVRAPFARLKKEALLLKGRGLPLELTFSCIDPKNGVHCGRCNKCVERKKAFLAAGVADRTKYVS